MNTTWYSPKEAASLLGICVNTLRKEIEENRLTAIQAGPRHHIRIHAQHIEEYLRRWTLNVTLSHHNKPDGVEIPSLINS